MYVCVFIITVIYFLAFSIEIYVIISYDYVISLNVQNVESFSFFMNMELPVIKILSTLNHTYLHKFAKVVISDSLVDNEEKHSIGITYNRLY